MSEVIFSNVAPVIPVSDLNRALRRYRLLGFSTRAYEGPARYGYVERNGVELHLSESAEHDRHDGAELYFYPMPTRFTPPGQKRTSRAGSSHPTTPTTGCGSSPLSTATEPRIASARRYRKADHHDSFRFARWRPESSQKRPF
jgi:hypothetical protein